MTSVAMPTVNWSELLTTTNLTDGSFGVMNTVPSPSAYSISSGDSQESSNISMASPMPMSISPHQMSFICDTAGEDINMGGSPYLKMREEPVEKFRFRYKSEMMGTHGSILGRNSDKNRKKSYPSVELCNYNGPAIIRCSLYTANPVENLRTQHTHRLVVRVDNDDKDDPHDILVSREVGYIAVFQGMGIIHTAKKHITDELIKKKRARYLEIQKAKNINLVQLTMKEDAQIRQEAEIEAKKMNLNSVSLCFEAFRTDENGLYHPICKPVFSKTINNMKSALTGELKICRIDKHVSSCMGGEEVFILVEKVGKKNIKIKFFEMDDEENEIWCDFGKFSELDVHHQYAIVFKTPPYRDLDIEEPKEVFLQLYRPTDGDSSEAIKFSYRPSDKIGRSRKRHRSSLENHIPVVIDVNPSKFVNPCPPYETYRNNLDRLTNPQSDPVLSGDCQDLFNQIFEETSQEGNMNSQEFAEFMNNLSLRGYCETLDPMADLATDGPKEKCVEGIGRKSPTPTAGPIISPAPKPKPANAESTTPNLDKRSVYGQTLDSVKPEINKMTTMCSSELLAKKTVEQLTELFQLKLDPQELKDKVWDIFNDFKSEMGDGPLHTAILNDQKDLLKQMLTILGRVKHPLIINFFNYHAQTPLHVAVLCKRPEMVKILLGAGADPNMISSKGDTPLHVAVENMYDDCITELLNKDNYLLSSNEPQLGTRNYKGWTPLHLAALTNNLDAVKKLVAAKANVNEVDSTCGRTVLHLAAEEGNKDIVEFLVKQTRVDVNLANYTGNTALHVACVVGGEGSAAIVKLLIDSKADPHKQNYNLKPSSKEVARVTKDIVIKEEPEETEADVNDDRLSMEGDDGNGDKESQDQSSFDLTVHNEASPQKQSYSLRCNSKDAEKGDGDVAIKEELDSEDEDDDDDDEEDRLRIDDYDDDEDDDDGDKELQGHSSFDLAIHNKEILELLKKVEEQSERSKTPEVQVEVKEEMSDSPTSECSLSEENGLFDEETFKKLCAHLDSSKGWVNLADLLDYSFLVPNIRTATSPSKLLLNYADLHGSVTVQDIRNFLEALDEHRAVEIIDLMLTRQLVSTQSTTR